jgi:pilus assembly protein Flp/PilA
MQCVPPSVDPIIKAERRMKALCARFLKDESGATAVEYGLIAAGISVAIMTLVQGLSAKLSATLSRVSVDLN